VVGWVPKSAWYHAGGSGSPTFCKVILRSKPMNGSGAPVSLSA
jgi:hypothetical protein